MGTRAKRKKRKREADEKSKRVLIGFYDQVIENLNNMIEDYLKKEK